MKKLTPPESLKTLTVNISQFMGADLTNAPSYISPSRSPECPNMIRESRGKVRKWIGWHTTGRYEGQINGFHTFTDSSGDIHLVHAGDRLYCGTEVVYSGMADNRSTSRQLAGKLIIADGKKLLMYSCENGKHKCSPVEDSAYVPTVVIGRSPAGGGTTYEAVNLLGKQRKDSFVVTGNEAEEKVFQLSAAEIDSVDGVKVLNSDGGYDTVTGFTVNKTEGTVTFDSAPGISAVTGQDNVIITYSKTMDDYRKKINTGDIMTLYGVSGAMDRIFIAGNSDFPNRDYYCQMENPCYWGDLWYCVIGQDNSKIMGYSVINDKLATHIDRSDNDTNIVLRTGNLLEDGSAVFRISGSYQGSGAVSKYAFSILETEPLFLTKDGIMAVTPSDVLGERYAQLRSYYLNGLLLKQELSDAICAVYDRFYMLAAGGYLFALDGTQYTTEKNLPYSNRQYEGFYRTNVPARVIANVDGTLIFGTADGRVCEFYKDYDSLENFNDDGKIISAKWTTPELTGKNFYNKKRFKLLALMIGSAIATGVRISARYDGVEEILADYDSSARYFTFSKLIFSKLSFKTDTSSYIFREKISVKPDNRKAQFIFENSIMNEPLALYDATIEFTESR